MHGKLICVSVIVGLSVLMTGCQSSRETDDVAYITAIGIDKAEQQKFKFTFQIVIPRAVGGAQGASQEIPGGPVMFNNIVASNVSEARNLLGASMSRAPNLTHIRALVISEEVARNGISDILASIIRFREYRGGIFVLIARGTAEGFIEGNKSKLDYLPTKFFESFVKSGDETGYHLRAEIHEFYLCLKNPGASPYASYVGINPGTGEDKPVGDKLSSQKSDSYLPAGIPRTGKESPLEFVGTAIFSGDKMVGTLDNNETRVLAMLQNNFPRSIYTVADPLQPQNYINLNMRNGGKPKIDVDMVDGQEVIKIKVFLEGEITGLPSGINYEKTGYRELLEEEMSDLVKQEIQGFIRHTQEFGSDVFGFGYYLRSHFSTYRELEETNLAQLYKTADVEVEVKIKLRRMGLMWRSAPYTQTATSE